MMSLVQAQHGEPKKRVTPYGVTLFFIHHIEFIHLHYGNSHLLVPFGTRLSVAQEVAEHLNAAGGRESESVQAQRSILCERSLRAIKIGNRKKKHDCYGFY